jgi:cytochrome c1
MDVEHRSSLGFQSPDAKARQQREDEEEDEGPLLDTEALFTAAFKRSRLSQASALEQPLGLRTPTTGFSAQAQNQNGQSNVAALKDSVAAEHAAAARLQGLLEHTLRGNRFSALASPGGMTPGEEERRGGGRDEEADASAAAVAMEDPLAFIQQCKRERERFDQTPF